MKKFFGSVLFVAYAALAILVTVLLLSFNEYNCSEIGGYTVYIVKDDTLEPEYNQGDILLIKQSSDKNISVGDNLFIYKVITSQEYEVVYRTLERKTQQGRHIIYEVSEQETYTNDYVIGKESNTTVIKGWGTLLSILESKWGYLFCVVIVSLLLFLQEVFELIMEIKYGKEENEDEEDEETKKTTKTVKTAKASTKGKTSTATKTTSKTSAKTQGSTKSKANTEEKTTSKAKSKTEAKEE